MSCDVGEVTERLENELSYNYELRSFSNISVTSPTSRLILEPFRRFTYVTAHSPTLPLLQIRHSSFYNPSFASPTSQALHLIHLACRPYNECTCFFLKPWSATDIIFTSIPSSNPQYYQPVHYFWNGPRIIITRTIVHVINMFQNAQWQKPIFQELISRVLFEIETRGQVFCISLGPVTTCRAIITIELLYLFYNAGWHFERLKSFSA